MMLFVLLISYFVLALLKVLAIALEHSLEQQGGIESHPDYCLFHELACSSAFSTDFYSSKAVDVDGEWKLPILFNRN